MALETPDCGGNRLSEMEERFEQRLERLEACCQQITARIDEWQRFVWRRSDLRQRFSELVEEWRRTRGHSSKIKDLVMNSAYQKIIGMGEPVIPLILAELERQPGHWSWALTAISGEDPIPPTARGRLDQMASIWLQWGREKGYR